MEGECRGNLGRLLSRRALRGVTGQRGALRSRAVDGDELLRGKTRVSLWFRGGVQAPSIL